jgi:hypothetical protein
MTTIQQTLLGPNTYYSPYMDQVGDLFSFTSFTFTNGGATGRFGPTSFASVSSYTSQPWYSTYFSVSSGIQYWYAPTTGSYTIRAAGAAGQDGYYANYSRGIIIESVVTLTKGMLYKILVGQKGVVFSTGSGGGGGGTFMTEFFNTPVIIAGGGGGATYSFASFDSAIYGAYSDGLSGTTGGSSYSDFTGTGGSNGNGGTGSSNGWGGGGGGLYGNGTAAGQAGSYGYSGLGLSFAAGGTGGNTATSAFGGFGGGAGTHGNTGGGGGGGGYSGGGGSNQNSNTNTGGGGGSYSQSAITVIGYNRGHGYLTITKN